MNNIKLDQRLDNNNHQQQQRKRQQKNTKLINGSLENVSSNPFGDVNPLESSLRRSRSLAFIRGDIFTNFDVITSRRSPRRSQLIPRAKLIDRSNSKDR